MAKLTVTQKLFQMLLGLALTTFGVVATIGGLQRGSILVLIPIAMAVVGVLCFIQPIVDPNRDPDAQYRKMLEEQEKDRIERLRQEDLDE
jgi:hypothetical protein